MRFRLIMPLALCKESFFLLLISKKKADDRTRTDNLLITSQLLCQLSHIGVTRAEYKKYIIILSTFRQVFFIKILYFVESIIKCRRNRYGFSCIIFLSEGRRKEVKTLNGYSYLTLEQRREIERMYAEGERVVDIAARLKRSAAAIYEELKRGYTGEFDGYARPKYSADLAQATVQENFRRRGNRRGANC